MVEVHNVGSVTIYSKLRAKGHMVGRIRFFRKLLPGGLTARWWVRQEGIICLTRFRTRKKTVTSYTINSGTNYTGSGDQNHEDTKPIKTNESNQSIIFNYSSITLTKLMVKLINRGLNFTTLPCKLDITEVLVDFQKMQD